MLIFTHVDSDFLRFLGLVFKMMSQDERGEDKINEKLSFIERFKAESKCKTRYDYFVVFRIVVPLGVTVSFMDVKSLVE